MQEIISICLNIITIGLTIYELFSKNSSNSAKQYIQETIIRQINPKYDIKVSFAPIYKMDTVAIKNMRWKSKRITQFAMILIYVSMAINFVNYIKRNTIHSVTDLNAIFYIPMRNTMIQLSIIIVLLCIIFIVRGWNKQQSVFSNLMSMKYFTLKIVADIFAIAGLAFVDYSLLEKISTNSQNLIYSMNIIGWPFLFLLQLFWIRHTVLKMYKLIPLSNTYEEKEKQLFAFLPVYIISILLFGLTIYTKFF